MAVTLPGDGTLTDLLEVLGRTADAMIAVDGDLRIVAWNDAATELLGFRPEEALGRPCHEVLAWVDRCGDPVCDADCPASCPGEPDELVRTRDVMGRSRTGRRLWLSATTIVPPPELRDRCRLIHLVREVGLPPELERLLAERLGGLLEPPERPRDEFAERLARLTPREREVLGLLTEGLDGATIAERLYLSRTTVRNHVQHILNKLEVHSRVEAVALALRSTS